MQVTINGVATDVASATSVAALVRGFVDERGPIAVAVNAAVVPRSEWDTTRLGSGDRVELLAATAGG